MNDRLKVPEQPDAIWIAQRISNNTIQTRESEKKEKRKSLTGDLVNEDLQRQPQCDLLKLNLT